MRSKLWKYSMEGIAKASGRKPQTVRRHRREGRFNPENLRSVAFYIAIQRLQQLMLQPVARGEE